MSSFIKLPQHAVVISCCKERKNSSSYGEPRNCSGQEIVRHMELLLENPTRLQQQYSQSQRRRNRRRRRRIGEMAVAFCMMESSSWCRYSKRRKRRRRVLQKREGRMEAGCRWRARHWNGIRAGFTGRWTSRAGRRWRWETNSDWKLIHEMGN